MSQVPDTLSARFKGDPLTPADWAAWEEKLSLGEEPSKAAKELGFTVSGYRRADPDRHRVALEKGRVARAEFVDARVEIWIDEENASPAIRQAWMKRWNPAYAERSQVELTGAEGGPIVYEGGTSLADVASTLVAVGALPDRPAAGGAVPAAGEVLA